MCTPPGSVRDHALSSLLSGGHGSGGSGGSGGGSSPASHTLVAQTVGGGHNPFALATPVHAHAPPCGAGGVGGFCGGVGGFRGGVGGTSSPFTPPSPENQQLFLEAVVAAEALKNGPAGASASTVELLLRDSREELERSDYEVALALQAEIDAEDAAAAWGLAQQAQQRGHGGFFRPGKPPSLHADERFPPPIKEEAEGGDGNASEEDGGWGSGRSVASDEDMVIDASVVEGAYVLAGEEEEAAAAEEEEEEEEEEDGDYASWDSQCSPEPSAGGGAPGAPRKRRRMSE